MIASTATSSPTAAGDNASYTPIAPPELSSSRRLGVLGIGLIMEEVGKGARLVASKKFSDLFARSLLSFYLLR